METSHSKRAWTVLSLAFAWFVPGAICRLVWISDPEPQFAFWVFLVDCGVATAGGVALAYLLAVVCAHLWSLRGVTRHGA